MSKTKSTRVPSPHIYTVEKVMTKKELEYEVKRLGECNREMQMEVDQQRFLSNRSWMAWQTLANWNFIALSIGFVLCVAKVWVLS